MSEAHDDLDFEPRSGIGGRLPEGETVLWQGAPEWRALARSAFHVVKLALYFAVLAAWVAAGRLSAGAGLGEAIRAGASLAAMGGVAVGILCVLARLYAGGTVYTLTTRRIVIRSGLALPVTFNLPLAQVERADVASGRQGAGSISFALVKPNRVALLAIWPNARPWRFSDPEPTLRCIAAVEDVARLVAGALQAQAGHVAAVAPTPASVSASMRRPEISVQPAVAGMAAA